MGKVCLFNRSRVPYCKRTDQAWGIKAMHKQLRHKYVEQTIKELLQKIKIKIMSSSFLQGQGCTCNLPRVDKHSPALDSNSQLQAWEARMLARMLKLMDANMTFLGEL